MPNSFNQFRCDISEKVKLSANRPGIKDLLELDLYPDVSIEYEGENLKIHGCLRLRGTYESQSHEIAQQTTSKQELTYEVPVEITLPARCADIQKICTEIEHFDYKLLSSTELQIEAILLLDGLLAQQKAVVDKQPLYTFEDGMSEASHGDDILNENHIDMTKLHRSETTDLKLDKELIDELHTDLNEIEDLGTKATIEDNKNVEQIREGELEKDWFCFFLEHAPETFTPMKMVIVQRTDTLDKLTEKYDVDITKLIKKNQLTSNDIIEGQILYFPN